MALLLDGTAGITFPVTAGSASAVQASSGRVLQVVNASTNTNASTSSSTYTDTGLTATITPSSTTSKILVEVFQVGLQKTSGSAGSNMGLILQRNGSLIAVLEEEAAYTGTTTTLSIGASGTTYLDSPATTSAVTYKTQFNSQQSTSSVGCQISGARSTITLMEIAA